MEATTATDPAGARSGPPAARATTSQTAGTAAYAAEFLGTLLLVLFVVTVLAVGAPAPDGLNYTDFAVVGLVHAFILMLLVASLGGASGAHFNPAVTIALAAKRKISGADAAIYIVVQLAGAVVAVLIAKALYADAVKAVDYGATKVADGQFLDGKAFKGMIVEAIGAFALMWAIMATAVNPRGDRNWAPLVIGATLGMAVMCFGPMSGAGFNPARSFGPALIGDFNGFGKFLLTYGAGPVLGALAAAFAYSAIVIDPQSRTEQRPIDSLA